jgi:hypothetical protein
VKRVMGRVIVNLLAVQTGWRVGGVLSEVRPL